jgi:predicted ester cyclase
MSIKENKDLVTRWLKEFAAAHKGDATKLLAVVDKYYAPNFVFHSGAGDLNLEQYRQVATVYPKAFPDIDTTVEDIVAEGDKVAFRYTWRGTHKGEFIGVAPTGKKVSQIGITIVRIAGRKIAETWAVDVTLGLMQQLGISPPGG